MVMSFDEIARGVVQVQRGGSRGSGFHLGAVELVATNAHVIAGTGPVTVTTETGERSECDIVAQSSPSEHDWALLRLQTPFAEGRTVFQPGARPARGDDVAFAGYPHGIPELLVHPATVSGPRGAVGFYVDGSINGGNSGGPVVDRSTGAVVGMVTARRYVGAPEMAALAKEASEMQAHAAQAAGQGDVVMMGISFTALLKMLGQSFALIERVASANANPGIGIAHHVEWVARALP